LRIRVRPGTGLAQDTLVPQLGDQLAAGCMHLLDDALPPRQRRLAEQVRQVAFAQPGIAECGGMVDTDTFGDEQAGAAFGAPP
jgi:hypothetical protein